MRPRLPALLVGSSAALAALSGVVLLLQAVGLNVGFLSRLAPLLFAISFTGLILLAYRRLVALVQERQAEARRTAAALEQERHLLRNLMDSMPDSIYFKDREGRFIRINQATARKLGIQDPAKAVGTSDASYFTSTAAQEMRKDELQVMETGQGIIGKEEQEPWSDGHVSFASTTTMPLRDSEGNVAGTVGVSRDITEQKRAERALRKAEQKYRSIFENAIEGIFQTSPDGGFLTGNPKLAQIFGFRSPSELLATPLPANSFYVESGRRSEFSRLVQTYGAVTGFESQIRRLDGALCWISENARAVFDAAGNLLGYEGTVVDITERKRAEETLRRANDTLRAVIQASPLAIITLDLNGIIRSWNVAAERMFGWNAGEVLDKPTPLVPDDRHHEYKELVERLARGEAFSGVQARRQRKGGELIDVSLSAAPLYDAHGKVSGIMAVIADITDIKTTEQALAHERALLRSLIDSIPDRIFYKDKNGAFVGCNAAFQKFVGRPQHEIIGRQSRDLYNGDLSKLYEEQDRQVMENHQPRRDEEWIEYPDGRKVLVEIVKTPFFGPDGQVMGLIGVSRDITERRRLEEQLRQAQKMEAVGQLAGGVAHDFNNLLTAILGSTTLLLTSSPEGDPNRDMLRDIERASLRAADLTKQLLGFSRQTLLHLEPVLLNHAVDETVGIVRRTIDPRITLVVDAEPNAWHVQADPSQMNQVLMNLCLNARDAMPEGGRLTLQTRNVSIGPEHARGHLDARAGEFVRLRVADTGHGIPIDIRPRIFDPFFTTKQPGKGTGLGLAMVFGIVKQHQGWIECHSEVGRGTHFDVYIPHLLQGVAGPPKPLIPMLARGGTETILLVDDEDVIRGLGRTILQRHGYQVLLAGDGEEAVTIYQRDMDKIDLIILDLTMPRLSGRDALRKLIQFDPNVRVLFSSGYSAEHVVDGDQPGVLGFVNKPYRPQELVLSVRMALDKARAMV